MQTQASEAKKTDTATGADCRICLTTESLHDLTGPANQMCSLADLIVKRYGDNLDSEAETLFGLFHASAHRLQTLLGGLRTYVHATDSLIRYQCCEGDALLAASIAPLGPQITRSGAIVTHDHLPQLICDPVQLSCVFTRLIENSIKFRGERAPEIHVSGGLKGDTWLLSIRDNGIGIPEQQKERIFEMFHRLHSDVIPGAGVGLTIAKRIMELHGGSIWVESELGHGATFLLTLPKNHD
jgi:chemotaxis family two-component system sensor kinase Cph1